MPRLVHIHSQQTDVMISTHTLTFFIHHGPETVPDEAASPICEPRQHSNPKISLQQSRPAIPSRRSSKSILKYVTTKYTDGTSEADYSSPRSSSPVDSRQHRDARRQFPFRRHLSSLGRRRAENNDAFRRLERDITSTDRSGVWSFETSSEESSAHEPNVDASTSHEAPSDPRRDRSWPKVAGTTSPQPARKSRSRVASPERPRDAIDPLVEQQPENSHVGGLLTNASRHLPRPSLHAEVALQVFGNGPAVADSEGTGQPDPGVLSKSSSPPLTQSRTELERNEPVPADLTSEIPTEFKPESVSPQQTVFTPANLINSETLWSDLSRWSDEFDQFPDSQQETTIQQGYCGVDVLRTTDAQQPGPGGTSQLDIRVFNEYPFILDRDLSEVHEESLFTALEPPNDPTAQIQLETALETFEVAAEASRNAFFDSGDPTEDERSQIDEAHMKIPTQPPLHSVARELLPIGVAAQNVQLALEDLPRILEPVHQLIFEEQSRAEGLRITVNENILLRQGLQAAHQAIAERDREIEHLRVVEGQMRGQVMPLLTSSFNDPSRATQTYSTGLRIEQTQESIASQGAVRATFGSTAKAERQDWTIPKFISRLPVYDHFQPDQRVIPRTQPSLPTRGRRLFPTGGNDADQELDEEENSDLHENSWQPGFSGQFGHAEDLASDAETVIHRQDHDSELYGYEDGTGDSAI